MNTMNNDKELKKLMKEIRLEKPGAGFSSSVMDAVLAETAINKVYRHETVLGAKFWIFTGLFIALAIIMALMGNSQSATDGSIFSGLIERFPAPELGAAKDGISRISNIFSGLPVTLASIMIASSILILADNFFSTRHKPHAG
jgi:hypothetical protein